MKPHWENMRKNRKLTHKGKQVEVRILSNPS